MTLTLDVGNTQITGGVFKNDKIVFQFRCTTTPNTSSDELGIFLRSVLRENGYDYKSIRRCGVCSVVPAINYPLTSAIKKYFGIDPLYIQSGIKTGLKLKYANPKEIGADRIAGAIGACTLHPNRNIIIIDLGTATTIDIVTKDKEYLGGAILAGLKISTNALSNGTAKLPSVEIAKPGHICATSTIEAIQSGLYYGHAGAIKEFCYLYKKNVIKDDDVFILGTGGFSRIFEEYSLFNQIVPSLVLFGVKQALDMNQIKD